MRMAFVTYDFGEYSIRHANGLVDHGEVALIMPRQLAEPHLGLLDPRVDLRLFDKVRLRQPWGQLRSLRTIHRHLRDFEPDVVHLQLGHLWFNLTLPALAGDPLVVTIHDPRRHLGDKGAERTPQWISDLAYRRADEVIVHGAQLRDVVATELGIEEDRIHVIPHIAIGSQGVSGRGGEKGLVLFFGRIWEYKGLEYLIRAQPRITEAVPDAKVMIAGQGEDFDRYLELMEDRSRFIVHNRWVSDDERADLFERASVVVLPYVEASQSGVVPIAYSHAKPVVATTTGGLPEAVEDGRTGFLVPPRDEEALAEAVIRLLRDDDLRREMGDRGKQKLDRESSEAVVAASTVEVYRRAIERHGRGRRPR